MIRVLLLLTTAVDVFWILFWVPYYNGADMAKWNYGLHMFVVFVSILEIALKVIIFFVLFSVQSKNKNATNQDAKSGYGSGKFGGA